MAAALTASMGLYSEKVCATTTLKFSTLAAHIG
jgi:hypothetical protein